VATKFISDLLYSTRMLGKRPLTTTAAVLTLALGIGGTTAMFSVVNAVLLRPLPFADPDRLVSVLSTSRLNLRGPLSPGDFYDFKHTSRSFDELTAIVGSSMSLTGGGTPEQVRVESVSGNFFTMLGVKAVAGRTFVTADDDGPWDRVVLSERLWSNRFGRQANLPALGVTLGGRPMEVIGVVPSSFKLESPADLWLLGQRGIPRAGAVPRDMTTNRDVHILQVIGKLSPGVSLEAAAAEINGHAQRLAQAFPATNTGYGVALEPLRTSFVGDTRPVLLVLLCAVAALLVIACVNVANLMLVRTNHRSLELRMRTALGASRGRLMSLIMIEAGLIAAIGGLFGFVAAGWGIKAMVSMAPANLARVDEISLDARVLACGVLLTLCAACAFGLWPAWRASKVDLASAIAGSGRVSAGRGRRRAQYALVASELAVAQVLLVAAGLLAVSFGKLTAVNPGIVTRGIVTIDVSLPSGKYGADPARKALFHESVLQKVAQLPGVDGVAMALSRPLSGAINRGVWIEGQPDLRPGERQTMSFVPVSETYFALLGIPVRRGRAFTPHDSATSEWIAVVNEAFARRYFGDADPLEQRIGFGDRSNPHYFRRVVGVVADTREHVARPAAPTAYIPFRQDGEPWNFGSYVIKTSLPPVSIGTAVQRAVLAVDGDQPISRVRTLDEALSGAVAVERFTTLLASLFAGLALVLAAVGAFGVVSHVVASRRRELGVRLALGAPHHNIVWLVGVESLAVIAAGSLSGIVLAAGAGRWMSSLLYEVRPNDPGATAGSIAVLVATALLATYLPVKRALAANPVASLRDE
jgi:putative ABC transport system permease protein